MKDNTNYAEIYVKKALAEVENFELACGYLGYDPHDPQQYEIIVKSLCAIGQFGTIRLARKFPQVKNEEHFRLTHLVGLHFYWLVIDFWADRRAQEESKNRLSR